jgi:hypothetical protein
VCICSPDDPDAVCCQIQRADRNEDPRGQPNARSIACRPRFCGRIRLDLTVIQSFDAAGEESMKRFVTLVAFVAFVVSASSMAFAQAADTKKPPTGTPAQGTEATLLKMEREAAAALVKRDLAGFGGLFADDATLIGPDGAVQTKAQLIADVKSGALVIQSTEIGEFKARVFGESAIATYTTTDKGKYKDRDISGKYRWTDVFVRRGGKWQVVASQGTPIQ